MESILEQVHHVENLEDCLGNKQCVEFAVGMVVSLIDETHYRSVLMVVSKLKQNAAPKGWV